MKRQYDYHAYLLRCWQESEANSTTPIWRFSLEAVRENQRHGFADLESLLAFLQHITRPEAELDGQDVSS